MPLTFKATHLPDNIQITRLTAEEGGQPIITCCQICQIISITHSQCSPPAGVGKLWMLTGCCLEHPHHNPPVATATAVSAYDWMRGASQYPPQSYEESVCPEIP
jgi:hypothetical protein